MDIENVNPVERAARIGRVGDSQDREKRRRRGDEFNQPADKASADMEPPIVRPAPAEDSVVLHYDEEVEQAFRERGDIRLSICGRFCEALPKPVASATKLPQHPAAPSEDAGPEHIDTEV